MIRKSKTSAWFEFEMKYANIRRKDSMVINHEGWQDKEEDT